MCRQWCVHLIAMAQLVAHARCRQKDGRVLVRGCPVGKWLAHTSVEVIVNRAVDLRKVPRALGTREARAWARAATAKEDPTQDEDPENDRD